MTGKELILKEGTAGIYRLLKKFPHGTDYKINVDPNATYREYWCAVDANDPNAIVLSSDDCQEYKEVTVTIQDGRYDWENNRVPRDGKQKDARQSAAPRESFLGKWWNAIFPGSSSQGDTEIDHVASAGLPGQLGNLFRTVARSTSLVVCQLCFHLLFVGVFFDSRFAS